MLSGCVANVVISVVSAKAFEIDHAVLTVLPERVVLVFIILIESFLIDHVEWSLRQAQT